MAIWVVAALVLVVSGGPAAGQEAPIGRVDRVRDPVTIVRTDGGEIPASVDLSLLPGDLIQTGKIRNFPIVLMGVDYWAPMLDFMRDTMVAEGTIAPEDLDIVVPTDSVEDAMRAIEQQSRRRAKTHTPKPKPILGESR
mgnify:CR=1 FL=1